MRLLSPKLVGIAVPLLVGIAGLVLAENLVASDSLLVPIDQVPLGWTQVAAQRYGSSNASRGSDGDADLYLECGLDSLVVGRLKRDQSQLILRLHRLGSAVGAMAMYLMKCGPEQPSPNLACRNSVTSSQFLAVRGTLVLVITARGDQDSTLPQVMLTVATALLLPPGAESPTPLLDSLPQVGRLPGSERVVIGSLTFPSALRPLDPELLGISLRTYAVASDYLKKNGDRSTVLLMTHADPQIASDAFTHLGLMLSRARRLSDRTRSSFKFRSQANEPVTVKVKKNHLTITIDRDDK